MYHRHKCKVVIFNTITPRELLEYVVGEFLLAQSMGLTACRNVA
jgi:hypothetical protein